MTRATGRRTRVAEPTWFRLMLAGGVLLGVVATVLVVVSEEARWLRLAVLAALWAALLAAFALSRARREARTAELKQEEGKRTYELELQREITARREYEAKVAEHARTDSDDRHREELAAIREQLDKLTQTLSGLLDGDLLVERLTLSAESTRVRQLGGDRGRLVGVQPGLIGQGMGPYPQRPIGPPPPPHRPSPVPPEAEDDTVQINLTKLTEHARAVRSGTTAADTAVPAAEAAAPADPGAVEGRVHEIPSDDGTVVDEAPAVDEIVVDGPVVDGPVVDGPVVDEVTVDEVVVDEGPVEAVEVAPVTEEPVGDPEPVVDELLVLDEEPVADEAPAVDEAPIVEEVAADETVADETVADETVADEGAAAEPTADEYVTAEAEPASDPEPPTDEAGTQTPGTDEPGTDEVTPAEPEAAEPAEENHHNAGVSVSDLLAAYGISSERRPRRRRAADDDDE